MVRFSFGLFVVLALAPGARAAVVVLANFTPADLTVTITEPEHKPQAVTLAPAQVVPVTVTGPADVTFPAKPANTTLRLDPYNAYVFLPDEKAGRRLQGLELPDHPPERDARPELNPAPRDPVKIPVTLLVDDADPRADQLWQQTLRKRFTEAAAVVEAHSGVRFEVAGFGTWQADPLAKDVPDMLTDFEAKVKVKPGQLAVGYTSRKVLENPKEPAPFGDCRPFPTRHVLLREWAPKADGDKVEVLIHHLGLVLGAGLSPDPGSVMREKVADGLALHPQYRFRFDPLNVLAMNLWADELRRGPVANVADAGEANKIRLRRVYKALLQARPGDARSLGYLNAFDREVAKGPNAKNDPGGMNPKNPDPAPPKDRTMRDEVARVVVRAVTARARANTGPGALTGDALTAAYLKAAAGAALGMDGLPPESPDRVAGFLIGVAVALDDSNALREDALTEAGVREVESDADRDARLAVLGNPTLRGRRDVCRRFAVGCGTGELLLPARAEEVAVNRTLSLVLAQRPAGVSFPALAAEFGGIAFARALRDDPELLRKFTGLFTAADVLPNTDGLRDGLSIERFDDDYGDAGDPRFQKLLADIRQRVKKVPGAGK